MAAFHKTASSFRQGARTLPGEYYTSGSVFADEQDAIFARQWNCVGRAARIPDAGDYIVRTVAGESLIVVRGQDGELRGLFNVCRHRGTRLCAEGAGRFSGTIQCPYHAWTYTTEGRLIGAPHMQDVEGFDKDDYPLHAAAVAEAHGFLFVTVDRDATPFEAWFAPMLTRLARFGLASLESGHRATYDVRANWKLVFQNYSECQHCPVIHPALASVVPYQSGANDLVEGPFLGGYMEIAPPHDSVTTSGRRCARLVSPAMEHEEGRRAYYYSLMPNLLLSIHPDYVNYYLLTPLAPDRTLVESEWLFSPSNHGDPYFTPGEAIAFWDAVNHQDWAIIERSQQGIASRRYAPGPYSPRESLPAAWDREYLRLMRGTN
ncbi:MAG: aromatic ring-hydroxylating dioxygenase subunit alpha [Acidobacteria bacterium]|nr:aromatic ring-hydroxylating dioxygenase subunit alpha [Acidobacteriota bacterium]